MPFQFMPPAVISVSQQPGKTLPLSTAPCQVLLFMNPKVHRGGTFTFVCCCCADAFASQG